MKKIFISILVILSLLTTAILPAYASAMTYRDVSASHWAYDSIKAVTAAGLMHGKVKNEMFSKNDRVNIAEVFTTLYRLAEEEEIPEQFSNSVYFGSSDNATADSNKWYSAPWKWAIYNGIAQDHSDRHSRQKHNSDKSFISYVYPWELFKEATRADIVLALYYYVNTYMEQEISSSYDLSVFSDWRYDEAYPELVDPEKETLDVFNDSFPRGRFTNAYSPSALDIINATEWAVSVGIIEGYPDGTIGIQDVKRYLDPIGFGENVDYVWHERRDIKYVTRAEYAVILDRFMRYLKEI